MLVQKGFGFFKDKKSDQPVWTDDEMNAASGMQLTS